MKNLTWQQWTAIGIIAALFITGLVLHFVQPTVSYAFTEAISVATFFVGVVTGYLLKKNDVVKTKTLLTD